MNLATELEIAERDLQWIRFLLIAEGDGRFNGFFDANGNPAAEIASDAVRQLNRVSRSLKAESKKWGPAVKRRLA